MELDDRLSIEQTHVRIVILRRNHANPTHERSWPYDDLPSLGSVV